MSWISVKDRLPKHGEPVLVFRPQVLTEDYTDSPIKESYYNEKTMSFNCYHQPTKWMEIEKPDEWNDELEERQVMR